MTEKNLAIDIELRRVITKFINSLIEKMDDRKKSKWKFKISMFHLFEVISVFLLSPIVCIYLWKNKNNNSNEHLMLKGGVVVLLGLITFIIYVVSYSQLYLLNYEIFKTVLIIHSGLLIGSYSIFFVLKKFLEKMWIIEGDQEIFTQILGMDDKYKNVLLNTYNSIEGEKNRLWLFTNDEQLFEKVFYDFYKGINKEDKHLIIPINKIDLPLNCFYMKKDNESYFSIFSKNNEKFYFVNFEVSSSEVSSTIEKLSNLTKELNNYMYGNKYSREERERKTVDSIYEYLKKNHA